MQKNTFTLQQYSCLAGVLLLMHQDAEAGAIYTDIEPDIVFEFTDDVGIDIDNNGTYDFAFLKYSHSYIIITSVSSESVTIFRDQVWAGPYYIENRIACPWLTFSGSPAYLPYALSEGILIDDDLSFQNYGYQLLAVRMDAKNSTTTQYLWGTGNWWPESIDHYLGVSFIDESSNYHFGWIRCSVIDSIDSFVIKDYAYETQENHPIVAGDTSTFVNTTDLDNNFDAVVYSHGNSVFVKLIAAINNAEIHFYTLEGKEIYRNELQNQFTEIKINAQKGIYFVEIIADEGSFTKKVYFN